SKAPLLEIVSESNTKRVLKQQSMQQKYRDWFVYKVGEVGNNLSPLISKHKHDEFKDRYGMHPIHENFFYTNIGGCFRYLNPLSAEVYGSNFQFGLLLKVSPIDW
ncbi:hypothetical protein S83_027272, partial [Arachis hypogaea]